jgi:hypothetical protein
MGRIASPANFLNGTTLPPVGARGQWRRAHRGQTEKGRNHFQRGGRIRRIGLMRCALGTPIRRNRVKLFPQSIEFGLKLPLLRLGFGDVLVASAARSDAFLFLA